MENNLKKNLMKYKSLFGLLVLCIIVSILSPRFLSIANIKNVLTQVSVNTIIAIGMTFVILTGGIDLSVGSSLAISGAVAATIVKVTGNVFLAIVSALLIGIIVGVINGIFISKGKIQAFIVTLATMTIFRGVTQVYTNGTPVSGLGKSFGAIGNKTFLGIPIPVVITLIVFLISY
ncbi:MAG: ribose ABC transporter permease, partial [Clostridiaceae bacterium]